MSVEHRIVELRSLGPQAVGELVRFQVDSFPDSPLVKLGPAFIRHFFYPALLAEGLIAGQVAYVDGRLAGFVTWTLDSGGMLRNAATRQWKALLLAMLRSIPLTPRRIAGVWEALGLMMARKPEASCSAEILTIAVVEEFRGWLGGPGGLHIARTLAGRAMTAFEEAGIERARTIVDENNLRSRLFFSGLGWKLASKSVAGWHVPSVELVREAHSPIASARQAQSEAITGTPRV